MVVIMSNSFFYSIKKGDIEIKTMLGDITKLSVDAIVNAANSLMYMGGGVAGAIKRAGGSIIEEEARKYAPVKIGDAIITTAGTLPAKYVIHAPTMSKPAMRIPAENVRMAMNGILKCIKQEKIKSVAIPALGTGVGGVNREVVAKIMVDCIFDHLAELKEVKEIILVDISKEQVELFKKELDRHQREQY